MPPTSTSDAAVFGAPLREQLEVFLDEHRDALLHCLDDLTEEEARRRLVPSATTLLGLVKHATFVELVWLDEAITGRSRREFTGGTSPDESFALTAEDTIASIREGYRQARAACRERVATLGLDDVVTGNRRGPLPLRWVYLHLLRELARHHGHADILREQILAARAAR